MQRHELDFGKEASFDLKSPQEAADMGADPFAFTEPANAKMAKQGWTATIAALQPSAYATVPARPCPRGALPMPCFLSSKRFI